MSGGAMQMAVCRLAAGKASAMYYGTFDGERRRRPKGAACFDNCAHSGAPHRDATRGNHAVA
ncbi:protein of unknown function [Burkholderia multivorans]